jgi:hypothetical protein
MMGASWLGMWLSGVRPAILIPLAILFITICAYLVSRPEPSELAP